MPASLKFNKNATDAATNLGEVKIIILEDGTGNKYTLALDTIANNLKVAYTPNGGNKTEYTVDGLANAIGKLLSTENGANKLVLVEKLGESLEKQDLVMYDGQTNQTAKDFLIAKGLPSANDVAANAALQAAVADNPALQTAVATNADLRATVAGNADLRTAVATNPDLQTAVAADPALRAVVSDPAAIAAIPNLQTAVARINMESEVFKTNVREVMSQQHFEIPDAADVPISADW